MKGEKYKVIKKCKNVNYCKLESEVKNERIRKNKWNIFESIKHFDENGNEYWYARELQKVLEYNKWENFEKVIEKAKLSCLNSNYGLQDHFPDVRKMVDIGSNTLRNIVDYKLSRYACYLIAQNGDSRKKVIGLAQTYFAIQTRKQELLEKEYNSLTEDEKRFYQRTIT